MLLGNARLNRILLQEEQLQPAAPMRSLVYLCFIRPVLRSEMPDTMKSHIRLAICQPSSASMRLLLQDTATEQQQCKSRVLAVNGAARRKTSHVEKGWEHAVCETIACLGERVCTC